jgi:glycosyltransferase involved in cell wall biosynthesis
MVNDKEGFNFLIILLAAKDMNVKVSVLIPVYNTERHIGESIESIICQSYQNFELIICDDCSTDKSFEIASQYALRDARIKVFRNEKNLGIASNRNRLVALAQGEYIVWQDADDVSLPNRIESQLDFLERNPDVAIVGGYLQFFGDGRESSVRKYASDDRSLRNSIFRYAPVAQPAAMIRKRCILEVGEYNPKYPYSEDLDMSFRLGSRFRFANLPAVLIKYRQHGESATFAKLRRMEINTLQVRLRYASGWGYRATAGDWIYNLLQAFSVYTVPPKFKIWLFCKLRNSDEM